MVENKIVTQRSSRLWVLSEIFKEVTPKTIYDSADEVDIIPSKVKLILNVGW